MRQGRPIFSAFLAGFALLGLLAVGTPGSAAQDANPVVVIETSMGNITVELNAEKAPITVKNFLKYVDDGFYEGTVFHRVIPGFMIQGGGMTPELREKPTNPPIPLEVGKGLSNKRGTIAMARTSVPNSATSQFFVNVSDNEQLDTGGGGYAVFGKVTEGMDVADKIVAVKTASKGPHDDVPVEAITIKSIKRKAKP